MHALSAWQQRIWGVTASQVLCRLKAMTSKGEHAGCRGMRVYRARGPSTQWCAHPHHLPAHTCSWPRACQAVMQGSVFFSACMTLQQVAGRRRRLFCVLCCSTTRLHLQASIGVHACTTGWACSRHGGASNGRADGTRAGRHAPGSRWCLTHWMLQPITHSAGQTLPIAFQHGNA